MSLHHLGGPTRRHHPVQSFTPGNLFAAGEQGAWFDPSDTSTLFQDSAGTTPVTAVEQLVGLVLDKSKGGLGGNVITNGSFASGTTGWSINTSVGTGTLTASGGQATLACASGTALFAYQSFTTVIGVTYLVTGSLISGTGTTFCAFRKADDSAASTNIVLIYGGGGAVVPKNGATAVFTATATTTYLIAQINGAGNQMVFTNMYVQPAPGNHATQATAGNRPTYRARYNLLTFSEQFDNAAWVKTNTVVNANATTDPLGSSTADFFREDNTTGAHANSQTITVVSGVTYTFICYAKQAVGTRIFQLYGTFSTAGTGGAKFDLTNGTVTNVAGTSNATSSITSVGSGWYLCAYTFTAIASGACALWTGLATAIGDVINVNYTGDNASGMYVWGADARVGSSKTFPYQSITTATSYNAVGFLPYLAFNGTSSAMATAAIDLSTTANVTVFSGLTKLSDAAIAILCETSASASLNGAFYITAPQNAATANYGSLTAGISAVNNEGNTFATYAAPITNVVTMQGASVAVSSATTPLMRINGAVGTPASFSTGTSSGNFSSQVLNIGARAGTSLFFNGNLYGLIVRGASSTAAEIASTEAWVNGKTGAY